MLDQQIDLDQIAQEAYNAYGESLGWKNSLGKEMPQYPDLPDNLKAAWVAASLKVLELNLCDYFKA